MPLIIGDIHATITVLPAESRAEEQVGAGDAVAGERERLRALDAMRLESERRIDQRDPDLLGGA